MAAASVVSPTTQVPDFTVVESVSTYAIFSGEKLVRNAIIHLPTAIISDYSTPLENSICWKSVDCTVILLWYCDPLVCSTDKGIDGWHFSTTKTIDCLPNSTPGHTISFEEMMRDAGFNTSTISYESLDKNKCYVFRLTHPEIQRVCKILPPKIEFIYSYNSCDETIKSVNFTSPFPFITEIEKIPITNFYILETLDITQYTGIIVLSNPETSPIQYRAATEAMMKHETILGYRTPFAAMHCAEKTEENYRLFNTVFPHYSKIINFFFTLSNPIDYLTLFVLASIDPTAIKGRKMMKFNDALKNKKLPRSFHIFICKVQNEFRFCPLFNVDNIKKLVAQVYSKISPELAADILKFASDY